MLTGLYIKKNKCLVKSKYILTVLFIVVARVFFACSCAPNSVAISYKASHVIFIGKYIGSTKIGSETGLQENLDNFEVLKFIKGEGTKLNKEFYEKNNVTKPVITLLHSKSNCAVEFEKDSFYIVYAYRDYFICLLTTSGCLSTHFIPRENLTEYISDSSGVLEMITLQKLINSEAKSEPQPETNLLHYKTDTLEQYVPEVLLINLKNSLQKEIIKRNVILWVCIPSILALLILIVLRQKKR